MRRHAPWLLLALTVALLLAANATRADAPIESENQTAASVFTESVPEALHSWFGPATFPPRLTLKLSTEGDRCAETGFAEIYWRVSGGVPPYEIIVDGQRVTRGWGWAVPVRCHPPATNLHPCDPLHSSHRTVRATATDRRGVSAKAEAQIVLGEPPSPIEPGAVLHDASAAAGLLLSWTPRLSVPPICTYELQYQATAWDATSWPDSWTTISDAVAANATEYLHDGLELDRRYRYRLRAANNLGAGGWSAVFPETGARPSAPVLEARTAASGSVALSWSAGPTGATRWEYRRRQNGGSWSAWTAIAVADASTAEHIASGLTEDATYHFQLRAHTASGPRPASATAIAVAGLTPSPPYTHQPYEYDYDATDGATARQTYAILSDAADLSSAIASYADAPTAAALLVNVEGFGARSYAEFLNNVAVGDSFTWERSTGCWFAYEVAELLSDPPGPARKLFAIKLIAQDLCEAPILSSDALIWGTPPGEPRIGADGIRILPVDYPVEGGHTYRISDYGSPGWIVIDIPAGLQLTYTGGGLNSDATTTVTLEHEASGATLFLKFGSGSEEGRYIPTEPSSSAETQDVGALFDAIVESARRQPLPR